MHLLGVLAIALLLPVVSAQGADVIVWVDPPVDELCIPFFFCIGVCCEAEVEAGVDPVHVRVVVLP